MFIVTAMWRYAHLNGADAPLVLDSRGIPEPSPEGVVVRTQYGGICHTDLHTIADEPFKRREIFDRETLNKIVLGHESSGTVYSLGPQAVSSGLEVGDRVVVHPWLGCGECTECKAGFTTLCDFNKRGTTEIGQGPTTPGGFGNYVPVPHWRHVTKYPDSIPAEVACMLPCSVLTTYNALKQIEHSVRRAAKVRGSAKVLIIGIGGLGMWCLKLANKVFPDVDLRITAGDVSSDKVAKAKEFGAADGVTWTREDTLRDVVTRLTSNGERMFDASIDFVGMKFTGEVGFSSLARGGTLCFIGLAGGQIQLPIPTLIAKTLRIQGMRVGTVKQLEEVIQLVGETGISAPPLEIFSLDQVNSAIDKLKAGEIPGRAVIKHQH